MDLVLLSDARDFDPLTPFSFDFSRLDFSVPSGDVVLLSSLGREIKCGILKADESQCIIELMSKVLSLVELAGFQKQVCKLSSPSTCMFNRV